MLHYRLFCQLTTRDSLCETKRVRPSAQAQFSLLTRSFRARSRRQKLTQLHCRSTARRQNSENSVLAISRWRRCNDDGLQDGGHQGQGLATPCALDSPPLLASCQWANLGPSCAVCVTSRLRGNLLKSTCSWVPCFILNAFGADDTGQCLLEARCDTMY